MLASRNSAEEHLKQILNCTAGVCFLGTPHCGADLTKWASFFGQVVGAVKTSNRNLLGVLRPESEVLSIIQHNFHSMIRDRRNTNVPDINMTCFFEELPVKGIGIVSGPSFVLICASSDAKPLRLSLSTQQLGQDSHRYPYTPTTWE